MADMKELYKTQLMVILFYLCRNSPVGPLLIYNGVTLKKKNAKKLHRSVAFLFKRKTNLHITGNHQIFF
jgi:hypothetical protein